MHIKLPSYTDGISLIEGTTSLRLLFIKDGGPARAIWTLNDDDYQSSSQVTQPNPSFANWFCQRPAEGSYLQLNANRVDDMVNVIVHIFFGLPLDNQISFDDEYTFAYEDWRMLITAIDRYFKSKPA